MSKENEIAVLDINRTKVLAKLKKLGARHEGKHNFKRIEFLINGNVKGSHSWGRVRTDGKTTTITIKWLDGNSKFSPMDEFEIKTNDFKDSVKLMSKLVNPESFLYFENVRTAYRLGNSYITLDKWPGIPLFLEVEAPSTGIARSIYKKLGVKGKFVGNVSIHKIYESYRLDFVEVMKENNPKIKKLLAEV